MRLICEISRALNAIREEQDSGLREGGEQEERRRSDEVTGCMLTRRHASLLIKAAGLQEAEHKLQLISTDAHNRVCRGHGLQALSHRSPQRHLDGEGGKCSHLCCG